MVSNFEGASELLLEDTSGMEVSPPEFEDLPAGTYIYGHRSLIPRRFERTEETRTKEIEAAHDVAAALKGIDLGKSRGKSRMGNLRSTVDESEPRTRFGRVVEEEFHAINKKTSARIYQPRRNRSIFQSSIRSQNTTRQHRKRTTTRKAQRRSIAKRKRWPSRRRKRR